MKNTRYKGFTINTNKTESIAIGNTYRDVLLEHGFVKGVDSYKYLGVMITKDKCVTEIKNCIYKGNKWQDNYIPLYGAISSGQKQKSNFIRH